MSLAPTLVTAALAGVFSGVMWPLIWPLSSLWLMLGTVVLVVLPAHAFVVGFRRQQGVRPGAIDAALLRRLAAWIACAAIASLVVSGWHVPA
jgi:hypothetical protein